MFGFRSQCKESKETLQPPSCPTDLRLQLLVQIQPLYQSQKCRCSRLKKKKKRKLSSNRIRAKAVRLPAFFYQKVLRGATSPTAEGTWGCPGLQSAPPMLPDIGASGGRMGTVQGKDGGRQLLALCCLSPCIQDLLSQTKLCANPNTEPKLRSCANETHPNAASAVLSITWGRGTRSC